MIGKEAIGSPPSVTLVTIFPIVASFFPIVSPD